MPRCLGDLTVSQIDEDVDGRLVAAATDLTIQTVRRRLREAHGNMLVRNVFQRDWPYDADALGRCTIALARDAGLAPEVAGATGLSGRVVGRRLSADGEPGATITL
jgi:hypothetical protein